MQTTLARPKGKRQVRFHGIGDDAKALGVNRATLYRLLTGEYACLKGLRRRYDELKARQGDAANQPAVTKEAKPQ